MPVKIFFSYAHEDELLLNKFKAHLKPLQQKGLIDWYDRDISAGTEWAKEIDRHLNEAQVILLLVSPDFIASEYCYGEEMERALERHGKGEVQVIPIILRPVAWQETPIAHFSVLPKNKKPITMWHNRDQAFDEVVTEIYVVVKVIVQKAGIDVEGNAEKRQQTVISADVNVKSTSINIVPNNAESRQQEHKQPDPKLEAQDGEKGGEELNKKPFQAHYINLGFSKWVLGRVLIFLLTLLWILGSIFIGLSFLVTIIVPLVGGWGLLVMYETWYTTKHPSEEWGNSNLTNMTKILHPRYLWKNPKLRIGSIVLLVILIAGILFYAFQPHIDRPTLSRLSPIPYPPNKGLLVLNDTLKEKSNSSNWDEDLNCSFISNAYHISVYDDFHPCFAENTNFSDFAFQVEVVFLTSNDSSNGGGIIFRADKAGSLYYGFFISEVGNGELFISTSPGIENKLILKKDIIPSFEYGKNQINLIAVVAQGEDLQVYVNKKLFADVVEGNYTHGLIGVFAQSTQSSFTSTEAQFTNARVWKL